MRNDGKGTAERTYTPMKSQAIRRMSKRTRQLVQIVYEAEKYPEKYRIYAK
jgi:hypothetical protein